MIEVKKKPQTCFNLWQFYCGLLYRRGAFVSRESDFIGVRYKCNCPAIISLIEFYLLLFYVNSRSNNSLSPADILKVKWHNWSHTSCRGIAVMELINQIRCSKQNSHVIRPLTALVMLDVTLQISLKQSTLCRHVSLRQVSVVGTDICRPAGRAMWRSCQGESFYWLDVSPVSEAYPFETYIGINLIEINFDINARRFALEWSFDLTMGGVLQILMFPFGGLRVKQIVQHTTLEFAVAPRKTTKNLMDLTGRRICRIHTDI
jgi:hypothetical protein